MNDGRGVHSAPDDEEIEALRAIGWQRSVAESCPDSSLLVAVGEGVLDDATAERVRSHVATCETCRLLARDLAVVLAEDVPTAAERAHIDSRLAVGRADRRRHLYLGLGIGGLATAAVLAWMMATPRRAPTAVPDVQVARAAPPPIASVFVVGRPSMPAGDVELTVRGEASTQASLEDQLSSALDKADQGDLTVAVTELGRIARAHSDSRIAALALGAVQLRAGHAAEAVATLEHARTLKGDAASGDEAGWFLAIALVRTGSADRARGILDDICRRSGQRSTSACAGVAELDRIKSPR